MATIPSYAIEYFLLGRTRQGAPRRYTQDGCIVTDVWLAFARNSFTAQRVLVSPCPETSAMDLGFALHHSIAGYRSSPESAMEIPSRPPPEQGREAISRLPSGVSALENFVAVTIYFDELIRILLPMTEWWQRKNLGILRRKAAQSPRKLEELLEQAIRVNLGRIEGEVLLRQSIGSTGDALPDKKVMEAAPIAALIGIFRVAESDPRVEDELRLIDTHPSGREDRFLHWVDIYAEDIARAARVELSRPYEDALLEIRERITVPISQYSSSSDDPPELIQRVFLDRPTSLADTEALSTIKADAATRVFDISCRHLTWAIIDSGVASSHPAFLDHGAIDKRGQPILPMPSRVRATYDFTSIQRIRNFDLIASSEGPARDAAIQAVVNELLVLPGRIATLEFQRMARTNLRLIARQLDQRIFPDWGLIEPLIRIEGTGDGSELVSDHGTHVAGILGSDWRREPWPATGDASFLRGVCPDIKLYDLRVIHSDSRESTEFAVLAALEFVQFVNARAPGSGPVIHGVNISLSIPHDVRNYACGATPICAACDRLVNSGVVVVAAAGNRGWNEQEIGFGNFVFCSITDPGNAEQVITVGATHRLKPHSYGVSYFSSRGPTGDGRLKPDMVAPGEQVRGPVRGEADDELDGTSMAAPFVSGAAAMLMARHRELIGKPDRIKRILCESATDLGRERYFQGHGLVDVLRALQSV